MSQKLLLYYKPSCPFCRRVVSYLESRGIDVPMKDTSSNPAIREELVNLNGTSQVPCLVIDGEPMLESGDIIAWFEANS